MIRVPPFTAYLDPQDPLRFLNYAIPDDAAEPGAPDVEALRAVFRRRDRLPRLEWIEEAAPLVATALREVGLTEELRTPLQVCAPSALVAATAEVDGLSVAAVGDGDGDVRDCVNLQRVAFGGAPLGDSDPTRDPRPRGGGSVLARVAGEAVAAAGWLAIVDGVTEIVGVATAEKWRRRGLAGVLTAAAARAAFDAGASLCILSPGNETAQGVYERAGFSRVATMLHWSDGD